jgi:imidazolonepropionase-like amidohydrolase
MKNNERFHAAGIGLVLACAVAGISLLHAQADEAVYIKAKKIYSCEKGLVITNGGILLKGKKFVEVHQKAKSPKGVQIIDLSDKVVIPGLIDAYSYLGFHQEDYNVRTEPPPPWRAALPGAIRSVIGGEEAPRVPRRIEARFRASEAVFYGNESFKAVLAEGIISALIAIPTENLTGGMPFLTNLAASSPSDLAVVDPVGVVFTFAGERNVARRYGDLEKIFLDAREYRKRFEKYLRDLKKYQESLNSGKEEKGKGDKTQVPALAAKEVPEPKEPKKDDNQEVILQILDKKIPALIRASRENEIQAALKLRDEFGIRLVVVGGHEAYKIPEDLKSRNVSVIAGPEVIVEKKGQRINFIRELLSHGIPVALGSSSSAAASFLPFQLSYAVQHGLSRAEALDTVTAHAAGILGVADRMGSIAAGKDADFVVLDGDPFELATRVNEIYLKGKKVYSGVGSLSR